MDITKPVLAKRDQLKTVSAVMLALSLGACGSLPPSAEPVPVTMVDMDRYRLDCAYKSEQLQFLQSQFESSTNLQYRSVARRKMEYLRSYCS